MGASFYGSYFHGSYVWMKAQMKAYMKFTRKQLPGFGRFRRICRTFGGNGSRSSFRGSFHGSIFHGRFRGSSGYRSTPLSPSLRGEGPSSEGSAIHHRWPTPMEGVRGNSGAHHRGTKYQTRTHGPTCTSFHVNFHKGCTVCTAA